MRCLLRHAIAIAVASSHDRVRGRTAAPRASRPGLPAGWRQCDEIRNAMGSQTCGGGAVPLASIEITARSPLSSVPNSVSNSVSNSDPCQTPLPPHRDHGKLTMTVVAQDAPQRCDAGCPKAPYQTPCPAPIFAKLRAKLRPSSSSSRQARGGRRGAGWIRRRRDTLLAPATRARPKTPPGRRRATRPPLWRSGAGPPQDRCAS